MIGNLYAPGVHFHCTTAQWQWKYVIFKQHSSAAVLAAGQHMPQVASGMFVWCIMRKQAQPGPALTGFLTQLQDTSWYEQPLEVALHMRAGLESGKSSRCSHGGIVMCLISRCISGLSPLCYLLDLLEIDMLLPAVDMQHQLDVQSWSVSSSCLQVLKEGASFADIEPQRHSCPCFMLYAVSLANGDIVLIDGLQSNV